MVSGKRRKSPLAQGWYAALIPLIFGMGLIETIHVTHKSIKKAPRELLIYQNRLTFVNHFGILFFLSCRGPPANVKLKSKSVHLNKRNFFNSMLVPPSWPKHQFPGGFLGLANSRIQLSPNFRYSNLRFIWWKAWSGASLTLHRLSPPANHISNSPTPKKFSHSFFDCIDTCLVENPEAVGFLRKFTFRRERKSTKK